MKIAVYPKIIGAVKALWDGIGVPDASTQFRVPIRTLCCRLKKLIPNHRGGKKPVFTPYEEGLFVTVTLGFEGFGLPLTRKKLLNMVRAEAKRNCEFSVFIFDFKSKNSNFKSNPIASFLAVTAMIDRDRLKRFRRRHEEISIRKCASKRVSKEKQFDVETAKNYVGDLDELNEKGYFKNEAALKE